MNSKSSDTSDPDLGISTGGESSIYSSLIVASNILFSGTRDLFVGLNVLASSCVYSVLYISYPHSSGTALHFSPAVILADKLPNRVGTLGEQG